MANSSYYNSALKQNIINLNPLRNPFEIYQRVFGYVAIPYPMALDNVIRYLPDYKSKLSALGAVLHKKNANGTEAFCPVSLVYKGKSYDFDYATIAITLNKNIQETILIGRRGSVKEMIQIEDYQFQINGIILNQTGDEADDELPQSALHDIDELFNINEPVQLKNAFAEIFLQKDNSVIIKSIDLPDMKGISGAQAFSMKVVSDTILELEEL